MDAVAVPDIVGWEKAMHEYMSTSGKDVLSAIEKGWDDETEAKLKTALTDFGHTYVK